MKKYMAKEFLQPEHINSIEMLEQEVEKVFLLADKGIVKIVVSTIIANRMNLDPVWLLSLLLLLPVKQK